MSTTNSDVQAQEELNSAEADQTLDLPEVSEMDSLKERANLMGIKFSPIIGLDKLRAKVNATVTGEAEDNVEEEKPAGEQKKEVVAPKTAQQLLNERRRKCNEEARKLVRIVLISKDPLKREWEGEYFTVSNGLIGTVKRLVPFDNENGWHVEQVIVDMLRDKQVQLFKTVKLENGDKIRQGYMSKAYTVEVLPPLTEDELAELATQQAARSSIG
jgi:hypothetical protein